MLTRTTRSVSVTEAGDRLLNSNGPHFDQLESEIAALSAMRDKPAGTVRITAVEHAAETILWPKLAPLLLAYPDINIEIISEYGLKDIVADRDAGVRLGEQVDKDMISVPIARDFRFAVVGAPSSFEGRSPPITPHDLREHNCVQLRLPTHGGFYVWEFFKNGQELKVRIEGRAIIQHREHDAQGSPRRPRPRLPSRRRS